MYNVKKGLSSLITYAEKYNHNNLLQYLREQECIPEDGHNVKLHKQCQRQVNNENRKRSITNTDFPAEKEPSKEKMLRSSLEPFDWKSNCLFCGKQCQRDSKHPERCDFHEVTTLRFKDEVLSACKKRDDVISRTVTLRVSACNDLVAEEARYHQSCRTIFKNPSKNFHAGDKSLKKISGRPQENEKSIYFEQLCEWIEQEAECYTITELHQKMIEMATSTTVYTTKWLKAKLIEKYKQHIFFAEIQGRSDIVCLKDFADFIVNNAWYKKREADSVKESERIIDTAAKLILAEVRSMNIDNDFYPLEKEIADIKHCELLLPANLRKFLEVLIK